MDFWTGALPQHVRPVGLSERYPLPMEGWWDLLVFYPTSKPELSSFSQFKIFMIQISHPNMTTEKTVALTRQIFVGKVMFLLFNMMSRYVITFLPRSKRLLISWLQSPSAVILEPKEIKSATVSIVSPSMCHELHLHSSFYTPDNLPST